jgi:putative nucleotidyltransferase with HDIG domain
MIIEGSQMQAIPIDEILAFKVLPVDIFILFSESKYLLIGKVSSNIEVVRKFKERSLDRFYVKMSDYIHLVELGIEMGNAKANEAGASNFARIKGLRQALSSVYREIEEFGMDENVFKHVKLVNHTTISFLAKNPSVSEMFSLLRATSSDGVNHALLVSLMSAMMGIGHSWSKPETIENLALGGLLHDIGKTRLPSDILNKTYLQLSAAEKTIYDSHAEIGGQMLLQVKSVPDDVRVMVQEHHEFVDGSGLPKGIKDIDMSPMAKVIGLADRFVEILEEADPNLNLSPMAIYELIEKKQSHLFNKDALMALRKILRKTVVRKRAS